MKSVCLGFDDWIGKRVHLLPSSNRQNDTIVNFSVSRYTINNNNNNNNNNYYYNNNSNINNNK